MTWVSIAIIAIGGGLTGSVIVLATSGSPPLPSSGHLAARPSEPRPAPLRLLSVSPADGARDVDGTGVITVTFSRPLPASAPLPAVSPAIAGGWRLAGDTAVFTPETGFTAGTHVTISVPTADGGPGSKSVPTADGGPGSKSVPSGDSTPRSGYESSFTTAAYSTLRLQELLARLGYLPMSWHPALGATIAEDSPAAQLAAAYTAPPGTFSWQRGYPRALYEFWKAGADNLLDRGAIMGFEADHGMTLSGTANPRVWAALLRAAAAGKVNGHGYSYAIASQGSPERLTIWHNGRLEFSSLANTGISSAPTPVGTFPVYLKMPFQVMQGTNPDGSHYADPVQWVSYFTGGSAVHYIPRGSYGSPQSLGCVELPYSAAEHAYPIMPYGTLVTVTP